MSETAETKTCPFCAEPIKAAAKKCPFCNSRLVRYALFRQEFVMGLCCLMGFGTFILFCAWVLPDDSGSRSSFAWHRSDLDTKEVKVIIRSDDTDAYYYDVSGMVTNKGNYPWRVQEIELVSTNTQGIPDVAHAKVENPFVVQPGREHAFVLHQRTPLTNKVVAARARVENARDGNAAEKND